MLAILAPTMLDTIPLWDYMAARGVFSDYFTNIKTFLHDILIFVSFVLTNIFIYLVYPKFLTADSSKSY